MTPRTRIILIAGTAAVLLSMVAGGVLYTQLSVRREQRKLAEKVTGGNIDKGEIAVGRYGCAACHILPGAGENTGPATGPPLTALSKRATLAGGIENRAENLIRWIVDPKSIDPETTMPSVGVTTNDARHIAAYLYATD